MKLYSCDFEGCTATTDKLDEDWKQVLSFPKWQWLIWGFPLVGNWFCLLEFITRISIYLCPEHAKRVKGLVRT